jgi:outer membrane protein
LRHCQSRLLESFAERFAKSKRSRIELSRSKVGNDTNPAIGDRTVSSIIQKHGQSNLYVLHNVYKHKWMETYMKNLGCGILLLGIACGNAMAQSNDGGRFVFSVGAAWHDLGWSSVTSLESTTAAGTFQSPTAVGQIHNSIAPTLALDYFVSPNISVSAAFGYPVSQNTYVQGAATPLGPHGPALELSQFKPLTSERVWAPVLLLKYHFGSPESRFRPFVGAGVNYTWYSGLEANPAFRNALLAFGGPGATVKTSVSTSWNPAVAVGFSYHLTQNWYATAAMVYMPIKANSTMAVQSASGETQLVNKLHVSTNMLTGFLGIGYRF